MKALTICQPYAELVMRGLKPVENRRHGSFAAFRGPLLLRRRRSER